MSVLKLAAAGDSAAIKVRDSYLAARARNLAAPSYYGKPADCLRDARAKVMQGKAIYRKAKAGLGAAGERGAQWAESPEALGFRFVGWSDELAGLRYTGWHLDPCGDGDLARGCVYQLPARNGRPRYYEAIRLGDQSGRGAWRDQSGDDSAILFLGSPHIGERRSEGEEERRDAARGADREAELMADKERDHQSAWQAGREASEALADAKASKAAARDLVREFNRIRRHLAESMFPAACGEMRRAIKRELQDWREGKAKAAELREQWEPSEPFSEGLES